MHYRIFDLWRFIAAVAIMLYHFLYFAPYELWRLLGPITQRPTGLLDLFFMISGFLVMERYGAMNGVSDFARMLRRRLAVLYPLHLLTLLFFLPVALAGAFGWLSFHNPERWALSSLPMHLLLLHGWGTTPELGFNLPSWSVSAEFFCYLAFPLIVLIGRRGGFTALAALLLVWLVALEAAWAHGFIGETHWSRANLFGAYRALVGFLAGCMVALAVERLPGPVRLPGGLWLSQIAVALALFAMLAEAPALVPLLLLTAGLFLAATAERAEPGSTGGLAPFAGLFQLSLGLYLWHMVLAAICYQLLWKTMMPDAGTGWWLLFSILPIAGTFAAAALSLPLQILAYRHLAGTSSARTGIAVAH